MASVIIWGPFSLLAVGKLERLMVWVGAGVLTPKRSRMKWHDMKWNERMGKGREK